MNLYCDTCVFDSYGTEYTRYSSTESITAFGYTRENKNWQILSFLCESGKRRVEMQTLLEMCLVFPWPVKKHYIKSLSHHRDTVPSMHAEISLHLLRGISTNVSKHYSIGHSFSTLPLQETQVKNGKGIKWSTHCFGVPTKAELRPLQLVFRESDGLLGYMRLRVWRERERAVVV